MSKEAVKNNPFVFDRRRLSEPDIVYPQYERLMFSYWRKGLSMSQEECPWEDIIRDGKSIRDYPDVVNWFVRGVAWGIALSRTERIKRDGQERLQIVICEAENIFENLRAELFENPAL